MKHIIGAIFLAALLFIGSTSAEAAKFGVEITGSDLLELCENGDDYSDGLCLGFVIGVLDISFDTRLYCLEKATNKQIVMVIVKWMRANPEELHFPAKWIVAKALFNVFPCRDQ
jgi:hypothetical protein